MKLIKFKYVLVFGWMLTMLVGNPVQAENASVNVGVNVGELAPDFEVTNLAGKNFKLSKFRGEKPIYLVFWTTWCSTCKKEIPQFKILQTKLGEKVEILAVNVDSLSWWGSFGSSNDRVKKYAKKYQLNYAIALDDKKKLIELYKVRGTPTQLVIDKKGIIRRRYPLFNEETARILQSVL